MYSAITYKALFGLCFFLLNVFYSSGQILFRDTSTIPFDPCSEEFLFHMITKKGKIIETKSIGKGYYLLEWGYRNGLKTFPDTFSCIYPPSQPYFVEENNNYLVLRNGCGTNCWFIFFLPMYKTQAKSFFKPLYYNIERDIVITWLWQNDFSESTDTIIVTDLKKNKQEKIKIKDKCVYDIATEPCGSLKKIWVKNNVLYYDWIYRVDRPKRKEKLYTRCRSVPLKL